ncbi:TonB-dependent receptor [soil metagenome]
MQRVLLIAMLIFSFTVSFAQKTTVSGRVYDSVINKALAYTTVSLVKANDSTLVTFTRADAAGVFKLNAIEKGKYLVSTSYVGYLPVWKAIEVSGVNGIENIGDINMQDITSAGDVTVNAKRAPVVINNDTLEFNTENFRTQPNAVVEDMLKKMPGVTVDKDGTIKVNGQTVRRVLVNGKEFFTGDVKMATQNLSADAVDKVQVFDKKSDQSEFTGIDDGNSEKTINLKLKKDKNNALFGKVIAGAGTEQRYDAQANVNKFKGNEQLSFLGMSNNTNRQGFQLTDVLNFTGELSRGMRNGGGIVIKTDGGDDNAGLPITGLGQNQHGVANTTAGGVNYNNTWNKGKTDWSSNYLGSDIHLVTNKESNTQNILPGSSFNRFQLSNSVNDNVQHKLNFILDQKIDSSFSFKITPSLSWQNTNKRSAVSYTSITPDNIKLNDGFSNTTSNADAFNVSNNALFRKRFQRKGRTISLNTSMTYNHSELAGTLLSGNKFYDANGNVNDSAINQTNQRNAITKNFGATLTYTEPLGKRSLFELTTFYNTNIGNSVKKTFDFNNNSGKHDQLNATLSNDYNSNYTYSGGGLNFRTNQKKVNITAGASLQSAELKSINNSNDQSIQQNFTDVLPTAILQYNISRMKNIRLEYSTSTTQPSLTQLQPVADISDPLNISIGNPQLQRQYNHSIQLNLFAANPVERKNLFSFISFSATSNAIIRSDSIKQNGTRISSYTNANGTYNIFGNLEYGFPLKKLKSRIEIGCSTTYSKNASFVNGQRNNIDAFSIGPNISYNFSIDNKIDIDLTARLSVNNTKYALQQFANNSYVQQNYGIDLTDYFPWGITLHNEFNYILSTGRTDGFNTHIPLWNASLAKSFLKNKRGEFKFSAFDLLNQNTGITRSSNQGYIVDEKYNVLQRYFLFSLTYSLNKSGLNNGGPKAVIKTFNN